MKVKGVWCKYMGKVIDKKSCSTEYSVLMAVYAKDNAKYLKTSIESILKQTILPEQFVVVIDGSVPNEIIAVINDYQINKDLFTIVQLEENGGLGHALNVGLQYCRNELVARMDADDISLPERCEKELKCFEKDETLDVCGCNIDEFEDDPNNILSSRIVPSDYNEIKRFMRRRQAFNHPTVIYKKNAVLKVGGYRELKRKEDFDLFSRMLAAGMGARNLTESLYLYRINQDNYNRRKSWRNLKSAIYVYCMHMKRKGCSVLDFCIVCCAEILFFLMPYPIMKIFSDNFLRYKPKKTI